MKSCPNCNAELKDGVKQCENCGTEIISKRSSHSANKSNGVKSALKIIIPIVAVLVVGAIVVSIIFTPSSSADSYFGYFKDEEVFISDYSEGYGEQATENFKDKNMIFSNYSDYVRISNDSSKLFYIDNYDGTSYRLYTKDLNNMNSKALKISSDIQLYDISDDGSVVTYIKDKGYLYQHNLKAQSDLIDKDVINFLSSDNGKTILYKKSSEGDKPYQFDLYLSKSGGKGKKLVSNIDSFRFISEDLSTVYYVSNGALCKLNVGKSPVKLIDNVREVVKVYESGEVYFTRTDNEGKTSLYYFNGSKESKALVENYYRTESVAKDKAVMVVCSSNEEISYSVIVKDKCFNIEQSVVSVALNSAGTEIHFTADFDTTTHLTSLYSAKIDGGLKNVKKVSGDVLQGKYLSGEKYVYVKDYDATTMTGTVYFDNKAVGKNIYYGSLKYAADDNTLLYFDKVEDITARLNKYVNGKSSVVHNSVLVNSLSISDDTKVTFLADYYVNDGILYALDNGKLIKIDHDVSSIFTITSNESYDLKAHTNF